MKRFLKATKHTKKKEIQNETNERRKEEKYKKHTKEGFERYRPKSHGIDQMRAELIGAQVKILFSEIR
jgi:hypothetical protein